MQFLFPDLIASSSKIAFHVIQVIELSQIFYELFCLKMSTNNFRRCLTLKLILLSESGEICDNEAPQTGVFKND